MTRVEFFEAPAFTRQVHAYLDDDELMALQLFLADRPEAGDVMPGTGGFRKLRWGDERRRKGKRGGLRVIYYSSVKITRYGFSRCMGKTRPAI